MPNRIPPPEEPIDFHESSGDYLNQETVRQPSNKQLPRRSQNMKVLWEEIESGDRTSLTAGLWAASPLRKLFRTKVPGGWLVSSTTASITFFPDPKHRWDGNSLP